MVPRFFGFPNLVLFDGFRSDQSCVYQFRNVRHVDLSSFSAFCRQAFSSVAFSISGAKQVHVPSLRRLNARTTFIIHFRLEMSVSMQSISTIGLDIAWLVFQVHGVDAAGQVVLRRQLRRRYVWA